LGNNRKILLDESKGKLMEDRRIEELCESCNFTAISHRQVSFQELEAKI
jgi:hypothetical protein